MTTTLQRVALIAVCFAAMRCGDDSNGGGDATTDAPDDVVQDGSVTDGAGDGPIVCNPQVIPYEYDGSLYDPVCDGGCPNAVTVQSTTTYALCTEACDASTQCPSGWVCDNVSVLPFGELYCFPSCVDASCPDAMTYCSSAHACH